MGTSNPRFLIDENLAGITRFLRFLGFDAVTARGWSDEEVTEHARKHNRVLVTRDRELCDSLPPDTVICVKSDALTDQLQSVLVRFEAPKAKWFSRCSDCNKSLEIVPAAAIPPDLVPKFVRVQTTPECWHCSNCGRYFWKGSHFDRTWKFLEDVLVWRP